MPAKTAECPSLEGFLDTVVIYFTCLGHDELSVCIATRKFLFGCVYLIGPCQLDKFLFDIWKMFVNVVKVLLCIEDCIWFVAFGWRKHVLCLTMKLACLIIFWLLFTELMIDCARISVLNIIHVTIVFLC